MNSQYGHTSIPRYWITLGKEILWDYPRQFVNTGHLDRHLPYSWPYATDISAISELIREYIDTPRGQILSKHFDQDVWGLTEILKAADRRIGRRHQILLQQSLTSEAAQKVLAKRAAGHSQEAGNE